MKLKYLFLLFIILFHGCSDKNAFTNFKVTQKQKLAHEDIRFGKIYDNATNAGSYALILLNDVYPERFENTNSFYISLHLKNFDEISSFRLNGKSPKTVKELPEGNKFASLIPVKRLWKKNFLVVFEDDGKNKINLVIDNGQFSSGQLTFVKDLL